jgi:hypothetical protein
VDEQYTDDRYPANVDSDWQRFWLGRQLLAYVERNERTDAPTGSATIVLDVTPAATVLQALPAINAAWRRTHGSRLATAQLVVEVDADDPAYESLQENTWHELQLNTEAGLRADLYRDLDVLPAVEVRLTFKSPLSSEIQQRLAKAFSLDHLVEALPEEITTAVRLPLAAVVGVAVYDVGQGSCGAICDANGRPLLYVDFGGGCLQNTRTYPPRRTPSVPLTFCHAPPVVLSHWDFDHWFSTLKQPPRPGTSWVVVDQSFGVRTSKFVSALEATCNILKWTAPSTVRAGAVTLVRCTGKSKNDSGIAVFVELPQGTVLFPGDATFDKVPVPQPNTGALRGLVATHHGSRHVGTPIPKPRATATLAYSFGAGNTYGHPAPAAQNLYCAERWAHSLSTPNGHIGIELQPSLFACCSGCTLGVKQC